MTNAVVVEARGDDDALAGKLLWAWVSLRFGVLVPKKRGSGYLRVPLGHHYDAGLAAIETAAGCDICGLDGALEFGVPRALYADDERRRAFERRIVPLLETHYGRKAVEISTAEYWARHPVPTRGGHDMRG